MAARENKLVLVEVGDAGDEACGAVRRDRELGECLRRQTVAIRMDMDTPQGKAFESRLLLYPYPAYAFFMPYGDLVGIVMPEEVRGEARAFAGGGGGGEGGGAGEEAEQPFRAVCRGGVGGGVGSGG